MKGVGPMLMPGLTDTEKSTVTTEVFGGYNHNLEIGDGEFFNMKNLTADNYPLLSQRQKRSFDRQLNSPQALISRDALCWIDNQQLYISGYSMAEYMKAVQITSGKKQIVSMGAYLCIFPDGIYFNTEKYSDNGYMGHANSVALGASRKLSISLCTVDGTAITVSYTQSNQPENATNGQYWIDTSGSVHTLKQYAATTSQWVSVPTVYLKLAADGIGQGFSKYDGIQLSGLTGSEQVKALNGSHILYDVAESYIVIVGLVAQTTELTNGTIKTARRVPEMDYVVQSGNRLWGCKYGMVDGKPVNEIYASKLGDCKNWRCFAGLATDSYAAARGSDGVFPGAVSYLGNPLFFKERCMERVYASGSGAHQIVTTECSGVQKGSAKSLQVVGGVLYYLSDEGVLAFDGSLPVTVSQALGERRYSAGVGGAWREKYYLSALDEDGAASLLVYDSERKLWHREDELRAEGFACKDGELYCLTAEGQLLAMKGAGETHEGPVQWMAETGELGLQTPERKRLTRLLLAMRPEQGTTVAAWVSYDQGATWQKQGQITGSGGIREQLVAIRPRQCRAMRLRLTGNGQCAIFAATALYGRGSDRL